MKQVCVNHFVEHGLKLSYKEFFSHTIGELGIKLEHWELDAIEDRLDKGGDAYIDLHDFIAFCEEYDIDLGVQVDSGAADAEAMIEQKNNVSYKDYKLTKNDYFNGCKTMLTSEKAALAKCNSILEFYMEKRALGSTQKYMDKDFGPMRPSDLERCKFTLYKNGEMPKKGYPDPRNVEFAYVEDIIDGKDAQFVDDGCSSNDCKQGNLGDCWLISAMSVLANRDELLVGGRRGMEYDENMIVDKIIADLLSKGVYAPVFHRYRAIGLYVIRLFIEFQWVYVIVDERIPVDTKTRKPVFGRCTNLNEMWVALIEKAFAKTYGCYENLISGYVDEGINALTAFPSEKIYLKDEKTGVFPHKQVQQYGGSEGLWKLMMERDNENCLMGCNINSEKNGALVVDGKDTGLIQNHAYSLNDCMELRDPLNKDKNAAPIRLIRLRNPWGKSEWLGAWSSNSAEMDKYQAIIQNYIHSLPPDEQFDMDADDGMFFMHYDDWRDNFSTLFMNIDFPEDWTAVRFHSKWTKSNAGGLPCKYEAGQLQRFAKNPQFLVKPTNDMEIFVSMA